MRKSLLGLIAGFAVICAGSAQAQQPPKPFSCGDIPNPKDTPKIAPIFRGHAGLNDANFDCMVWQDFIFLNWPALTGQRGVPNPAAKFGAAEPTVWETYKTTDEVFLPDAANPGPWNDPQLMATLSTFPKLAQRVSSGAVRHLTSTSKVSREVLASVLLGAASTPQNVLDEIAQAGGGTLYDLNGYPVYYEVSMNKMQYDYVVQNGLYDATIQSTFSQTQVIDMPAATGGNESAVEVKAAWKVLSTAEQNSHRFHTIDAVLGGSQQTVKVGLVGFHVFISDGSQGAWGTIAQIDNAPVGTPAASGSFNFFNPKCVDPKTSKPCAINVKDADPGQVVQITPDGSSAAALNTYMHAIITQYDPKTPWQYYKLVNVQWAKLPVALSTLPAPATTPLPDGNPNTPTMVNAVLETFLQKDGIGCFLCHQNAKTASTGAGKPRYAASYSFTFEHATTPK